MPKRCQKENKELFNTVGVNSAVSSAKIDQNFILDIVVGSSNTKRWNELRTEFSCKTNEEFTTLLLDFAEKQLKKKKNEIKSSESNKHDCPIEFKVQEKSKSNNTTTKSKTRKRTKNIENKTNNCKKQTETRHTSFEAKSEEIVTTTHESLDQTNVTHSSSTNFSKIFSGVESRISENVPTDIVLNSPPSENKEGNFDVPKESLKSSDGKKTKESPKQKSPKQKNVDTCKTNKTKKKVEHDIRKAPELNVQASIEGICEETQNPSSTNTEKQRVAIKIKLCASCGTRHIQDYCPLQNPHVVINDSLNHPEWTEKYKHLNDSNFKVENDNSEELSSQGNFDKKNNYSFAFLSLPNELYLEDTGTSHGLGVFAKNDLKEFTQFGPLIGKMVKEVDIPEDSTMKNLWEIHSDKTQIYMCTESLEESNWITFVRPAHSRDERNVSAITKNNQIYLVTTRNISSSEELVYWQDNPVSMGKKKMEKTSCGGCNMTFAHPLYYRTHCSVFHDIRYSLTIRKYHCKVCGAAVLGKENIMKHAAELHNGQGAYQCQFCKKFFLRLNYLEMHRTYGCSANPHRSRPLCDFCGRKFCQPQKLKVHIKRMHSDMSEVLKEFQCKNCLKILGSRAALQRHLKEVHHKQIDGACACSRCGKLFQNKSNLKIHMLTHSGIKPFKCAESNCNAAFTTKQCLQFHYKKVHGFTGDMMPKIERSVDYTFEAYSGLEEQDNANKNDKSTQILANNELSTTLSESKYGGSEDDDDNDDDDENSFDDKNIEDPPAIHSPIHAVNNCSRSDTSPSNLEVFNNNLNSNLRVLSKGSKKWIGEEPFHSLKTNSYQIEQAQKIEDAPNISVDVDDSQNYDRTKLNTNLNTFNRHESSNASLLVEAALDSVCSEPGNIDMDVTSTPNCTDALVNNLYTLAHPDNLPDVTYSHSVDVNETRDINLISPSVNDHISVTDDLNDELRHNQNIGIDYSTFHQDDFSPPNSPNLQQRNSFVRDYIVNTVSPQEAQNYDTNQSKPVSPVASPPRYDFNHTVSAEPLSSDDSNGIGAQNLSLNNSKNDVQLDLSIYKSPYNLEASSYQLRKDFRMKFDMDNERKHIYVLEVDDVSKNYNEDANNLDQESVENIEQNGLASKDFENVPDSELKQKDTNIDNVRAKYSDDIPNDIRNKFELDLDFRLKNYENIENANLRSRNIYDGNIESDFRLKNYDLMDGVEARNKTYDGLIDSEFRSDRNFEPLLLNSSELQGLDMSARSYHNYSNLNRYHPLYPEVDRPSVDLRLNYSPPATTYTHADILRVVSLDLTPPGRHSVDLSLRTHPLHQIANSRLLSEHSLQTNSHRLLDQSRLLNTDLSATRHLSTDSRLLSISEQTNRILSDHTTNRLLSNDQISTNRLMPSEQNRLIPDESRLISDQPRLLEQSRLISEGRILPSSVPGETISPVPYVGYPVSPSPYHPTPLAPRPHVSSPNPSPYPHYSAYY